MPPRTAERRDIPAGSSSDRTLTETLLDDLRREGALAPGQGDARRLRQVAARDLSLGRLYEGHVNALRLVELYGTAPQRARCLSEAEAGVLFGVWGADDRPPVTAQDNRLSGAKRFASGLGLVGRAVVTAGVDGAQQLFLVAADDPARQDLSGWDMAGMQDSRSGRFDCTGLAGEPLGPPDIYTAEPHFVGGTWRIAAVTLGGTAGLLDAAAEALRTAGRMEAEAQLLRLAPIAARAVAAWPAVRRAGAVAEGPAGAARAERAATLSVAARLLTEALAQDAVAAVERSVGLALFHTDHPAGRRARDLACYVRQAGPDAFTLRVGRAMLLDQPGLGGWMDD